MRTITKPFNIYTFDEASAELKDKIRYNFETLYNIYEHSMQERIETLKALADVLNASLDYSLSCVPDRREFISFEASNCVEDLDYQSLIDIIKRGEDCPLTGCCYDHDIIDHIDVNNVSSSLDKALNTYINAIHDEYEAMLSDEYLSDLCNANDYEFTEDGKIY